MGEMTAAFREQMKRLMGLKFAPADITTHWEALRDVPIAVLTEAVTRAQKTRAEFPSPVELRQDCDAVAHLVPRLPDEDRSVALDQPYTITVPGAGTVVSITREWHYYCDDCEDSGQVSVWCGPAVEHIRKPWQPFDACGQTKEHWPHEWVRRCHCYETNTALVRKREAQRQYADKKASRVA